MDKKEIEWCLNSRLNRGLEDNSTIVLAIYYLAKVIEEKHYNEYDTRN